MSMNSGNIESPFHQKLLEIIREDSQAEVKVNKGYLESIVNAIPGGLIVYQLIDGEFKNLYVSPKIPAMLGMTMEEYTEKIGRKSGLKSVYEPDRDLIKARVHESMKEASSLDINVRFLNVAGEIIWVNIRSKVMSRRDGAVICCGIVYEISAYSQIYRSVLDEIDEMVCVWDCETKTLLYFNKTMKDRILYSTGFVAELIKGEYEFDFDYNKSEEYSLVKNLEIGKKSYNVKTKSAELYGRKVVVMCISDVTENTVLKSRFNEVIETLACSCIKCRNNREWTVVDANDMFYNMIGYTPQEFKELKNNSFAALVPDKNIQKNKYSSSYSKSGYSEKEYYIVTKDNDVKYIIDQSVLVEEDEEEYFYTTFFDITERKLNEIITEEKYQEEINYRNSMSESLFASCKINLTSDIIVDWNSRYGDMSDINTGMSFEEAVNILSTKYYTAETIAYIKREFSIENLKNKYDSGIRNYVVENYIDFIGDTGMWGSFQISLRENPYTKDIEAFIYLMDVSDKKYLDMAINKELVNEYDFISCIDAVHNKSVMIDATNKHNENKYICPDYNAEVERYSNTLLLKEDREEMKKLLSLETVLAELEKKSVYEIIHREMKIAGVCYYKKYRYTYLDKNKGLLLFSQRDVTESVMRENRNILEKVKQRDNETLIGLINKYLERQDKLREDMINQAHINSMTGLLNINGFSIKVKRLLEENPDKSYFIVVRDINKFKVFNELYGRTKGDEFLKYMANNYSRIIADLGGVCGYLGSDDFVSCYSCSSIDKLEEIAAEVNEMVKAFPVGYKFITTAGVYKIEDSNMSVDVMCNRAQLALYEARNNMAHYEIYDDKIRARLINSQEIVNDFPYALKNQQFKVYLQPQYNINNGKIVGAEALVRWTHPVKGVMPPGEFIPVLERNGLIPQLDCFIAEEVFRLMRLFKDTLGSLPPAIAMNLSRMDIFRPELISEFNAIREKYDMPSIALRLEITESLFVSQPDYMTGFVNELRNMGYKVEMDDFGSGYSSLNALKDLEIDLLKLDMEFLSAVNTEKGAKIIKAVVKMADDIGVPVLTEGVETKEQVDFLKSIGCKYVQGYYFGKPMSIEDYIKLIMSSEYEYITKDR